jgi:serine/threonine protein kinase
MEKIGKYSVMHEIGRGATATVYLASDPFSQREVAIKLASPEVLTDPSHGKLYSHLFLNEASLVGKLNHPHIVQIFDAAVADDLCYIVMEYVSGGTLEAFCSPEHLLSIERVVEIAFKCTRALDFAFRLGITHRDIKPANILLVGSSADSGDIKISDFGAAIVDSPDRTQVAGIGSPAYMSPQQVKELPLDHQTDIYSLGVVMYQLLTGQLPFQANNNYNMIYQIINTEPARPSVLRAEIPEALDAIVARAMSKELEDRYATWEVFAQDLAKVFRNQLTPSQSQAHDFAESEKFDTLRALAFFTDFSDVELWEILRFSRWQKIQPEETIMHDGEAGDFFCLLADGELQVSKHGTLLSVLKVGDCFGEMAVIRKGAHTRAADVITLTESKLITIQGEALAKASEACRMHFYQSFLEVLTDRLTLANIKLAAS